ncbi:MAG: hypothetical protein M3N97_15810 [Pseudomonadota bacterium]|nr:hypothetical protein [Pseudomonadota bacterium]
MYRAYTPHTMIALYMMPCVLFLAATQAHAQTDEIQVYNGEIAAPSVFNLTLHDNYTIDGSTHAGIPGGIVPNHSLDGVAEWAYGVTD